MRKTYLGLVLTLAIAGLMFLIFRAALFVVPRFVHNWKHDSFWAGGRSAALGYFAGCHYGGPWTDADDTTFSRQWEESTREYEFGFEDVAKIMPDCLQSWKDNLEKAKKREENPPQPKNRERIEDEIMREMNELRRVESNGPRELTDKEREEAEQVMRAVIESGDNARTSEDIEGIVKDLEAYQEKFLKREFTILKK